MSIKTVPRLGCNGSWKKKGKRGDTLIEVIFAFAILSTIIGFAFGGAIQARKSAVAAQQRTQALLIAQYQASALSAYRDSLPWNITEGSPSFINGQAGTLPDITVNPTSQYCLLASGNNWRLLRIAGNSNCNALAPELPNPTAGVQKVQILFNEISQLTRSDPTTSTVLSGSNSVSADISINWTDPFGRQQSVKNIVILSRQK